MRHYPVKRNQPCKLTGSCNIDKIDVRFDSYGNVVLAGHFGGSIDFGGTLLTANGANDMFLVKLDRNGDLLWSSAFGDGNAQCTSEISGGSSPGSGQPRCHTHLAIDSLDNVLLGGHYAGGMTFGATTITSAGKTDAFLAKFGP